MKKFLALMFMWMTAATWVSTIGVSTTCVAQGNPTTSTNPTTSAAEPSPAERSIAEAQRTIGEKPEQYTGYNLLATALIHRARETSEARYYAQADNAIEKSLQLAPNNFDTRKIQVSILLGEHEFPAALDAAQALNKQSLDDVMVYGLLTVAYAELGDYKDAETAAQWMLNLRPGNLPALINAARLRELFGDIDGSYELLQMAYDSTPPTENEQRAWLLTQMGHLRVASGNTDAAEKLLQQALASFPSYPLSVGALAEVRIAQKRYEEAVVLLRQRYQATSRTANLFDLAKALRLAGHEGEAKQAFAEFESKALLESSKKDNSNRELIFYYADYAKQPAKALKVAEQEYAWRKDVYTLDAYAWALHVNGQDVEARKQIETALQVGIRDAKLFRHAGEIALKSGDSVAAQNHLRQSAELNTADSEQARVELASLLGARSR
ncbi:MAG TPA: tetratricopeptide repeat protein [Candidatus Eremiobacteraceae bacterium]|nr:tetratricopeptide repeat protein [Candidatus Eremiobacteraceae bacterium]